MQVRRNLLQAQIVFFVAVRTANVIEMLAFCLLGRERRRRPATRDATGKSSRQKRCTNAIPISTLNSGDLRDCSLTSCSRIFSLSGRADSGQAAERARIEPASVSQ